MDKAILKTKTFWAAVAGGLTSIASAAGIGVEYTKPISEFLLFLVTIFLRDGMNKEK